MVEPFSFLIIFFKLQTATSADAKLENKFKVIEKSNIFILNFSLRPNAKSLGYGGQEKSSQVKSSTKSLSVAISMGMARYQVFLDGICHICSKEAHFLKRNDKNNLIEFIDISSPDFDSGQFGLDLSAVHRQMHVKNPDGEVFIGIPAFIQIWSVLPKYRWLARVLSLPVIFQVSKLAYKLFARIRPLLPKRKTSVICELG